MGPHGKYQLSHKKESTKSAHLIGNSEVINLKKIQSNRQHFEIGQKGPHCFFYETQTKSVSNINLVVIYA